MHLEVFLDQLFAIRTLPPGRRVTALRGVREAASQVNCHAIVQLCDEALAHDGTVIEVNVQWTNQKHGVANPVSLRPLDVRLDRLLFNSDRQCQDKIDGLGADHPTAIAAKRLQNGLFPSGATAVARKSFVEESVEVERILWLTLPKDDPRVAELGTPPFAPTLCGSLHEDAANVGIMDYIDQLAEVGKEFRKGLAAIPPETLTWGEVRAARETAHEWLLGIVSAIIGQWPKPTAEHRTQRGVLLAPILKQIEAVTALTSQRRPPTDINPDTGVELPTENQTDPNSNTL